MAVQGIDGQPFSNLGSTVQSLDNSHSTLMKYVSLAKIVKIRGERLKDFFSSLYLFFWEFCRVDKCDASSFAAWK